MGDFPVTSSPLPIIMIQKIKNKEFIVKNMLTEHPKTRDNDSLLLGYVWLYQCGGKTYAENMSMWDFIVDFSRKNFAEVSGISRCRRKLQEEHPELRGKLYDKRHQMKDSVKEEIKHWSGELF